ncbi:histidinol phosphate aminotransferase [Luteococcus japonicus]|uniref:Histidinol-phosphate aminotransferase n=2 Tax=Luteococcus japonicus TaxID=33984 RepID=A0A1R4JK63_9ACTN|nr:histidinol-phosphate transaminase [Luteococcus japonicus]ROR53071.1 histidinol phosphate aminotransferase [Luteococcus japonicus]SJN32426.1 Histidinol-phosphate aminotransferase [Luteococcus japonicus LSP_Lj1]
MSEKFTPITLDELPLRPELVGEEPYGAPQLDVPVCLNVNENPYPPSDAVREQMGKAIAESARTVNRYPDREAIELRTALATYLGFGLGTDNIWAANGSNEVMTHLLQAFGGPGRTVLGFSPTYSMYPEYARNTLTNYVAVPRSEDFRIEADAVLAAVEEHRADIILITTPNNPTGTTTPVSVIDEICTRLAEVRPDCIVVVDEAYQEFTEFPEDSALALLPRHQHLVVSRTMSKAFAYAGGRLGYLAATPAIVDACRIVRLPYHLSGASQAIALVALANSREMLHRVDALREQCQLLQQWLREQGYDVVPSQANFCLFGRFEDRHEVWQKLLDRGVLIRETGPDGFLRVSAGTPREMKAFREALTAIAPTITKETR